MNIFSAIIMGIVQGLTEFLPVSSSGHLVLLERIFGIYQNQILINVALHVATLCAVIIMFRKDIYEMVKHPFSKINKSLVISVIPTVIIVLIFKDIFEDSFSGYPTFGFLFTALILIICQSLVKSKIKMKDTSYNEEQPINVNYKTAILAGVMQGVAVFPGVSRSGSTISTLLISGTTRESAVKFSFLMSIPIIIASLVYELFKLPAQQVANWYYILVGFIFAFVFGLVAIKIMIRVVKNASYLGFAVYLIILSIFLTLNQFIYNWF